MRIRVFFTAGWILLSGSWLQAQEVFTDEESFLEAIGEDYFFNGFDDVGGGPSPPLTYDLPGWFGYRVSAPDGLFGGEGEVSTAFSGDSVFIDFNDTPAGMIGANLWVRDADFNVIPGRVTLVYSDGTVDEFPTQTKSTFRGYRTYDDDIERVKVGAVADGGVEGWPVMDRLYVQKSHAQECFADCNRDGSLDLWDFLCFIEEFNAGVGRGDCNSDGFFDLFDFMCYTNVFNSSC
jgi:hypothetical protein